MINKILKKILKILAYLLLSILAIAGFSIFCLLVGAAPGAYMDICFWNVCGYEATGKLGGVIGFIVSASFVIYMWMTKSELIFK